MFIINSFRYAVAAPPPGGGGSWVFDQRDYDFYGEAMTDNRDYDF